MGVSADLLRERFRVYSSKTYIHSQTLLRILVLNIFEVNQDTAAALRTEPMWLDFRSHEIFF